MILSSEQLAALAPVAAEMRWTDFLDTIADLQRQLRERDAAIAVASEHVKELRDAWQRGCIRETDGKGGTRSNRNADVDLMLARLGHGALDAYVRERINEKRLELCKELGIEPAHSWANIVEAFNEAV
jgi:hypothetical protein